MKIFGISTKKIEGWGKVVVPSCSANRTDMSFHLEGGNWEGWFPGERQICNGYKQQYAEVNKNDTDYINCSAYLSAAGENGRKPMTFVFLFFMTIILLVEACGFGYLMMEKLAGGMTELWAISSAAFMGVAVAATLGFVMHSAGEALYKVFVLKSIRRTAVQEGGALDKKPIGISNNNIDESCQPYQRQFHRFGFDKDEEVSILSFWPLGGAIALATVVAIVVFMIRSSLYSEQIGIQRKNADELALQSGAEVAKTANDNNDSISKPGDTAAQWTFGAAAGFFVIAQLVGIGMGYSRGFGSAEGEEAYKKASQFLTANEFKEFYNAEKERVIDACDQCLGEFRKKIREQAIGNEKAMLSLQSSSGRNLVTYMRNIKKDRPADEDVNNA